MNRLLQGLLPMALMLCFSQAYSQELLGAKEVIRRIQTANGGEPGKMTVFEFANSLRALSPKLAGEKWANACLHKPDISHQAIDGEGFDEDEYAALPGQESWPYIDAWFTKNKAPLECQLLGSYLVGDRIRQRKLILQIASESKESLKIWSTMFSFGLAWRDKELVSKAIHKLVDLQNEATVETNPRHYSDRNEKIGKWLKLPDLVIPMGEEFAASIIQYVLKHTKRMVLIQGNRGQDIAVTLCKKEGSTYPIARYELIQRTSAGDLYPLLLQWFPKDFSDAKKRAKAFYTQLRFLDGKDDIDWSDFQLIQDTKYTSSEYEPIIRIDDDFEEQLLLPAVASRVLPLIEKKVTTDATQRELEIYHTAMTTLGRQEQMKPVLEQVLLQKPRGRNDNARNGAAEILRSLAAKRDSAYFADLSLKHLAAGYGDERGSVNEGMLLNRPDLVEKGLQAQKAGDQSDYLISLLGLKRYSELEANALRREFGGAMVLLHMYSDLGREQDVLDLLDQFPDWHASDLKHLDDYGDWEHHRNLFYEVAKALLKTGRKPLGLKILRRALAEKGMVDDAYDLFVLTVGDSQALKELEEMAATDPFDPYPLVWRAKILLRQRKFEEAEKAIRKAFIIDPFDISEPRCKAALPQKVLRDILKVQGKKAESDKLESLIEAILVGEKAERFGNLGLDFEAAGIYEKAVALYPDCCANQASLAMALNRLGRESEAEIHFRKAFELMPDSMGDGTNDADRLWGLFEYAQARRIAETVFTERLRKEPRNPRLMFLMGTVKEEQKQYSEAISYFDKTVAINPQYLNAWYKFCSWDISSFVTSEQSELGAVSLVRLDPMGRYGYFGEKDLRILNPTSLYNAVRSANRLHFQKETLYRLAASSKENSGFSNHAYAACDTMPGAILFDTELPKSLRQLVIEKTRKND